MLLCLALLACTASAPSTRQAGDETQGVLSTWEKAEAGEECEEDDTCITVLCAREECGVYRCKDLASEPVLLAYRGGIVAAPGSSPRRNWGQQQRLPGNGLPIAVIPWRFHDRRELLPSELARLRIRNPIKHHLFPQQPSLARWFRQKGINIHEHTMVVEKEVHDRIHRGAQGGAWNAAWREFRRANDSATEAQIWEHAMKLIFRFEIAGPLIPYHWRVGPQPVPRNAR
ncbi:SitA6 family polymorphic toxin lipoprotein [Stigmatella ashevillensis]|uniref:SitA6 family polymorphic toxin lipoprotein n=1 Tax=Stigmatella ashevillensis TaxID=2995309 RepID=UPI00358DCD6B